MIISMLRKITILITLFCLLPLCGIQCSKVLAQNDPTLAALIVGYTEKAKSQYQSQAEMMLLQAAGHEWTKAEVEGTYKLQREFNDYLDSFRSVIVYAAQIYGFYHEIDKLIDNFDGYTEQLSKHPGNAVAVALSANRNTLYRDIITNSVDIVNDVRQVCLNKNKMTEKERLEILFGIRPKLKEMNRIVQRLTKMVKYTSMADIWREIDGNSTAKKADKASIAKESIKRWKNAPK